MRLFTQNGVTTTSLRDIIKAMNDGKGVGMSVFYYYFESKDDLVNACLSTYFDQQAQDAIEILDDPSLDVQDVLDGVAAPLIAGIQKLSEAFADNENWYNYLGSNANLVNGFMTKIISHLAQALSRWLEQGKLPRTVLTDAIDTETLAWLISDGMSSVIDNRKMALDTSNEDEMYAVLFEGAVAFLSQLLGRPLKMPQAITSLRDMTARC